MSKVLITGGTSGLGYELVKCFLENGNEVFTTGRDPSKLKQLKGKVHFVQIDFSDLTNSVKVTKNLIDSAGGFDIIVNNAGVLSPTAYALTSDGFEYSIQVNFLSHLIMNEIILTRQKKEEKLIIIYITSPVYKYFIPHCRIPDRKTYKSFRIYSESKLYMMFSGFYLAEKYPEKNHICIAYDPGIFRSGISRMKKNWFQKMYKIASPFMRDPHKIAQDIIEKINSGNLFSSTIYSFKSAKPGKFKTNHYERLKSFMDECSEIIKPYLNID